MSLKSFLFGEAKQAYTDLKAETFIGPNLGQLREDVDKMHKRATALVTKLENEIRRLGAEYESAVFAAKGWALLVEHHAMKEVEADLAGLDLSPEPVADHPPVEGPVDPGAPVKIDVATAGDLSGKGLEPDPLEAGQLEAAAQARAKLRKGK